MRLVYYLLMLLTSSSASFASHIIGGYIRVAPLPGQSLTYLITATMYYRPEAGVASAANSLYICFGNKSAPVVIDRNSIQLSSVDKNVYVSEYRTTCTYDGAGVYTIQATAVNRSGAVNIKTGDQPFSIQTTFQVGPSVNSTPVLSLPATGLKQGLFQRMALLLAATDVDGDSLTYSLATPLTSPLPDGTMADFCSRFTAVPSYQFPNDVNQKGTYRLNAKTGLLIWDVPTEQGQYAVVIAVSEWRNGARISQTQHEVSLTVADQGGTPITPPAYEPTQVGLLTAVPDVDLEGMLLNVSPNPATGESVQVDLLLYHSQSVSFELLDSQGRVYKTVRIDQPSKRHEQSFDLEGKPAGLYLIRAESGGKQVVRKLLKQ